MAAVKVLVSLDESTVERLDELVRMTPGRSNKSLVIRELIDKEFTMRKGAMNEA